MTTVRYATREQALEALMADVLPVLAELGLTARGGFRWRDALSDEMGDFGQLWVEIDPYPPYSSDPQYEPSGRPYRLVVPTARRFRPSTLSVGSKATLIARLREHFSPEARAERRAQWAASAAASAKHAALADADGRLRQAAPVLRDALLAARPHVGDTAVLAQIDAALEAAGAAGDSSPATTVLEVVP